jgi:hypothetical protein
VVMCVGSLQSGGDGGKWNVFSGDVCRGYCCYLVQPGGDGGKWKGVSGDVCWFGTGWGRRREMGRVRWSYVLVWYREAVTEGNGKCSMVISAAVTVMVWYRVG